MDTCDLLFRMLRYQAWANEEILGAMMDLDAMQHVEERSLALRLMNHCLVVNKIFIASGLCAHPPRDASLRRVQSWNGVFPASAEAQP
ncbi:hypothetical protein [Burkholderia sp. Bp8998]|uniref:hypothetical protein n=1 Tax=Burkholderia sp. Bp8998 TaxID=2184557 RepID=UPI0021AB8378|nr:hypothetical protein [Burkholderia sp. Bp8998]